MYFPACLCEGARMREAEELRAERRSRTPHRLRTKKFHVCLCCRVLPFHREKRHPLLFLPSSCYCVPPYFHLLRGFPSFFSPTRPISITVYEFVHRTHTNTPTLSQHTRTHVQTHADTGVGPPFRTSHPRFSFPLSRVPSNTYFLPLLFRS